jgi:two-component system response regulator RegA
MSIERASAVLIVDDDVQLRSKLADIAVRAWTLRPFVAGDCATGLALARAHRPAFAVIDLQLPGGTGIELIRALRAEDKDICLVLITGYGTIELAVEAMRAGANDILGKPFTTGELECKLFGRAVVARSTEDTRAPFTIELLVWEHVHRIHREAGSNVLRTARLVGLDRKTVKRYLRMQRPPR